MLRQFLSANFPDNDPVLTIMNCLVVALYLWATGFVICGVIGFLHDSEDARLKKVRINSGPEQPEWINWRATEIVRVAEFGRHASGLYFREDGAVLCHGSNRHYGRLLADGDGYYRWRGKRYAALTSPRDACWNPRDAGATQ